MVDLPLLFLYPFHTLPVTDLINSDADMSLVTYNWVRGKSGPAANFNVKHQCNSWTDLYNWSEQHKVEGFPKKPKGVAQLERIP